MGKVIMYLRIVQEHYDYIILGAGLSGLMMVCRMIDDPFFKDKKVLLLDQKLEKPNDRTWCFWHKDPIYLEGLISTSWSHILVASQEQEQQIPIAPYRYSKIEGQDFYKFAFAKAKKATNVYTVEAYLEGIEETTDHVIVKTNGKEYKASYVLNSIFNPEQLTNQQRYDVLQQHFIGWFIKTKTPKFDPDCATFMDFSIAQRGNCRFMYVLPTSSTEALFEYTLFSEDLLSEAEYEAAIADYLIAKGITDYSIERKEKGSIPMTCYPFEQHNTARMIHIGTAGGWTRPSTGYTFQYTLKQSESLIHFLKTGQDFNTFAKRKRSWYFDLLLLDVLKHRNDMGGEIFTKLFQRNPVNRLFRFLDGETTPWEEFLLVLTPPPIPFIRALFRKLSGN